MVALRNSNLIEKDLSEVDPNEEDPLRNFSMEEKSLMSLRETHLYKRYFLYNLYYFSFIQTVMFITYYMIHYDMVLVVMCEHDVKHVHELYNYTYERPHKYICMVTCVRLSVIVCMDRHKRE